MKSLAYYQGYDSDSLKQNPYLPDTQEHKDWIVGFVDSNRDVEEEDLDY